MIRIACTLLLLIAAGSLAAEDLGMVTADGFGTVDSTRFKGAQAKMLSRRAAVVDAQRNLAEIIEGVRITSGTTVKDMTLASDVIGSRVKGMVRGAFVVSENIFEDSGTWVAEVKMAVCLNSGPVECRKRPTLTSLVQPSLPKPTEEQVFAPTVDELPAVAPTAAEKAAVLATGMIVDLSGLGFSPMLDVRIQTEAGKELYGPGHVDSGADWLHWSNAVTAASEMTDIVGTAPLVVKAIGIGDDNQVLISQEAAVNIFGRNLAGGDFLKQGKVIFVVD